MDIKKLNEELIALFPEEKHPEGVAPLHGDAVFIGDTFARLLSTAARVGWIKVEHGGAIVDAVDTLTKRFMNGEGVDLANKHLKAELKKVLPRNEEMARLMHENLSAENREFGKETL